MIQLSIEQGKDQLANEAGVQVQGKPIEVVELDCTISKIQSQVVRK